MRAGLTLFACVAIAALIGISIWATGRISIVPVLDDVLMHPGDGNNPWLVATLFDAYFGFLWFWLWVAYKESSWLPRMVWLLLILALGNIAMGAYILIQLFRLPPGARIEDLLIRRS